MPAIAGTFAVLRAGSSAGGVSSDGLAAVWASTTLPSALAWTSIAWNGSLFCAIANDPTGNVITSPDGITWTSRTLPGSGSWSCIAWNGTVFFIASSGTANGATSPDGITWTARTLPEGGSWTCCGWNGSLFCLISGSNDLLTSPDGITWTIRTNLPVTTPSFRPYTCVAWNGTVFCAVSAGGTTSATSPDGITWTAHNGLPSGRLFSNIAWNGSVFCAVPNDNSQVVVTSPDGITWTTHTLPTTDIYSAIAWNGSVFCAVARSASGGGSSSSAATSPDGATWTNHTLSVGASGGSGVSIAAFPIPSTPPIPLQPPIQAPRPGPYHVYQTTPPDSGGLAPTFLTGPAGQALEGALGDIKDYLTDKARQAAKVGMPLVSPSDALPKLGLGRLIPRGLNESDASYSARLQGAWTTWPNAGTAFGLLTAFSQTGYTNVVLAQPNGSTFYTLDGSGNLVINKGVSWTPTFVGDPFWSRFDVLFPAPLPASWTSGGVPASNSDESNLIRLLISYWKPAYATCGRIIIITAGSVWDIPSTDVWDAAGDTWNTTDATTVWTP